jgi:uncharacterized protein
MNLSDRLWKELERIVDLVNTSEIFRMGKIFTTEKNNYFYDTGTGKVIELEDEVYYIFYHWYTGKNIDIESFVSTLGIKENELIALLELCLEENLLRAIKPQQLYTPNHFDNLEYLLDNCLEQLILEVTGKCNLRCRYCIYNDTYVHNREFNKEDMTLETAKKAVDYFFAHGKDKISITFYGGEPLVRYELLTQVIEYCNEINMAYNKKLSFGFTTNMTLMTEAMAEYFAGVPNLNIMGSLDGPIDIQDEYRKKINGTGSFNETFNGLKNLCAAYKKYNRKGLSLNVVFAPPYTYGKLDEINSFFKELDFLPDDTNINISYPTSGSVDNRHWINRLKSNPKYHRATVDQIDPLGNWQRNKVIEGAPIENKRSIETSGMGLSLLRINDRYINDTPTDQYPLNGCCVPGSRRLYVNTSGSFLPCERIGTCPDIGNVASGISYNKVKKFYVDEYCEKSIVRCANCWAIRLCSMCYAGRYNEKGFEDSTDCDGTRREIEKNLVLYHFLLESHADKLDYLKDTALI